VMLRRNGAAFGIAVASNACGTQLGFVPCGGDVGGLSRVIGNSALDAMQNRVGRRICRVMRGRAALTAHCFGVVSWRRDLCAVARWCED
jgi:hypothetical protein